MAAAAFAAVVAFAAAVRAEAAPTVAAFAAAVRAVAALPAAFFAAPDPAAAFALAASEPAAVTALPADRFDVEAADRPVPPEVVPFADAVPWRCDGTFEVIVPSALPAR
ncbi:hypothetical protein [Candidatus Blastococcus massiliensis]|uniref:hypothetical protein n=1 Tax=Candidatus Blastococcus massiliensis TaxID=1470358 RepID=UPI0004BCB8BF|nr:hypothetical protein [Candidatus Blastococcus massiliensis]